jgi:hypothetical protein
MRVGDYPEILTMRSPTNFDDETRLNKVVASMLSDQKVCMSLRHSISGQWRVDTRTRIANGYQALLSSGSLGSRSPAQVMDSDM